MKILVYGTHMDAIRNWVRVNTRFNPPRGCFCIECSGDFIQLATTIVMADVDNLAGFRFDAAFKVGAVSPEIEDRLRTRIRGDAQEVNYRSRF